MAVDLDAYFARIAYRGSRAPVLQTLQGIVLAHTQHIPFENFDPLLHRPVRLAPAALEDKLVRARRGGYCFEHNGLLQHVLRQLGFRVTPLSGRVLWGSPPDVPSPRTHMVLQVELDGRRWLTDVGFGAMTLTGVLDLDHGGPQDTPHGPFRLQLTAADARRLEAEVEGQYRALYRFTLDEQYPIDFEVANHYTSTHPDSRFLHNLMMARCEPGRRYALLNNVLHVHEPGKPSQRRVLSAPAELREVIEQQLLLPLPDEPELQELLVRLVARA
jgi:N-hydroxyarylamine O-acetyltransferase